MMNTHKLYIVLRIKQKSEWGRENEQINILAYVMAVILARVWIYSSIVNG